MKTIITNDTAVIAGLFCLGYRPKRLQKNEGDRIEFIFEYSEKLEKDMEETRKGNIKFSVHELSIELHSVRSRIKTYTANNK